MSRCEGVNLYVWVEFYPVIWVPVLMEQLCSADAV